VRTTARSRLDYTAFGACLPKCFERTAGLYPNRIAVHCRLGEITYADLNAAANRLAHRILESGGQVGDRVALLMPQDRRIFIAMLARRLVIWHISPLPGTPRSAKGTFPSAGHATVSTCVFSTMKGATALPAGWEPSRCASHFLRRVIGGIQP